MTTCRTCSRQLRDPVSLARGVGPVCDPEPRTVPRPVRVDVAEQGLLFEDAAPAVLSGARLPPLMDAGRSSCPDGDCPACGSLPWGLVCDACGAGKIESACFECGSVG